MSIKIARLSILFFAFVLAASAFCFEFKAVAGNPTSQNTNSSTTTIENANTGKTTRGRGRRHKRRAPAISESTAVPGTELIASASSLETTERPDLSGTYTGTFDCPDAGANGETTLTITGNQFTLTDGKTGRIVAATTRGYTGATMQFGEFTVPAPGQAAGASPVIVSMRARKSGDRLILIPISGENHVCSFTPTGASQNVGRRHRRARAATPAAVTESATPETMAAPAVPAEPATPATPAPRRGGRRGRRANPNTNMNNNTGDANVTATPTPTPAIPRN